MRDDYDEMGYDLLELKAGDWPKKNKIGIDRSASDFFGIDIGDRVIFELDQTDRALEVNGKIRHPFIPPPSFGGEARFFVDAPGMERFNVRRQVQSTADPGGTLQPGPGRASRHRDQRSACIGRHRGWGVIYQDPTEHWGRIFIEGFNFVLQVLAFVSLFVSAVLVTNTLTALITQQTNQIGIIKAIGGRNGTMLKVYLSTVLIYGLLAFAISVAPGALVAYQLTKTFLNLFNIDYDTFQLSTIAVGLQVVAALATPLIAALWPISKGMGTTVREAMASYGLSCSQRNSCRQRDVPPPNHRRTLAPAG